MNESCGRKKIKCHLKSRLSLSHTHTNQQTNKQTCGRGREREKEAFRSLPKLGLGICILKHKTNNNKKKASE